MQPVRILQVNHCMDRNGAETLIMNIYRKLDRTKVQFDFLLHCNYKSDYEEEIKKLGGNIYKIQPYMIYNHFLYKKALEEFLTIHPQYTIVHGHLFNKIEYLKIAKQHGLTTIIHCHASSNGSGIQGRILDFLHRDICKYSDYKFACSQVAGCWLYGKNEQFYVIKNGIDTERFKFSTESSLAVRQNFNIPKDAVVLGHVGRFDQVKNHKFLLDVFTAFHNKNPNSFLLLVGTGPLENEIAQEASNLRIKENVIFLGSRPDVFNVLCAMDVFVFPSLYEGLPVTLVEAQCSGLPCIIPAHITEELNITNLLTRLPLGDTEQWVQAIESALDSNKANRNNYNKLVQRAGFDITKTAQKLQDFYIGLQR